MKYGNNVTFQLKEHESTIEIIVSGIVKGIGITPMDFGRDLVRRQGEGISLNPAEEIDVIQGIDNEVTTGEDVIFIYKEGDVSSAILLVGVLVKKMLNSKIEAKTIEMGGISTNEKNDPYIKVALQKMIINKDSLGGAIECIFPWNTDINKLRVDFSSLALQIIPEICGIEFGNGLKSIKETSNSATPVAKKINISLTADSTCKHPCPAMTADVIVEAIANIALINNL